MTVSVAVAVVGPVGSLATRVPVPAVAANGMLKAQVNAPAAVVVMTAPTSEVFTLQEAGVIAIPSKVKVTAEVAAKFVAVTVTLLPKSPPVKDMVHAVTVNEADVPTAHSTQRAKRMTPTGDPGGMT